MGKSIACPALLVGLLASCGTEGPPQGAAASSEPNDAASSTGALEVEYIGHAAFLLRSPTGIEVLLDPYASRVWIGYDFPNGIDPDVVAITHPHYDHDAGRYRGAPFPWPDAQVIDAPDRLTVGDVTIHGVEGKHADPYGMEFGQLNTIMVVEVAGLRLAHVGDNGPLSAESLEGIGAVDVLFMPMDGEYHILSEAETRDLRAAVPHRLLVPMHYRLGDLEPSEDGPDDLGGIEPVLAKEEIAVIRVGSHVTSLTVDDLPPETMVLVFDHSPDIPVPGS